MLIASIYAQSMNEPIDLLKPRLSQQAPQVQAVSQSAVVPQLIDGQIFSISEIAKQCYDLDGKVVRVHVKLVESFEQTSPTECRAWIDMCDWLYFPRDGAEKAGFLSRDRKPWLDYFVLVTPRKLTAVGRAVQRGSNGAVIAYVW